MRWAIITETIPPDLCGAGEYAYNMAKSLVDLGEEALVLTREGTVSTPEIESYGVLKGIMYSYSVRQWLKEHPVDVVVINYSYSGASRYRKNISSALIAWGMGSKHTVIGFFHELPYRPLTSRNFRSYIREIMTLPPVPIAVVPDIESAKRAPFPINKLLMGRRGGIHQLPVPSNIRLTGKSESGRVEYDWLHDYNIATFGIVKPGRGLEYLINILAPGERFLVVGGGDPVYMESLVEMAKHKGTVVTMTGYLDDSDVAVLMENILKWVFPFIEDGASLKSTGWAAARVHGCYSITTSRWMSGFSSDLNTMFIPWNQRFDRDLWVAAMVNEDTHRSNARVATWPETVSHLRDIVSRYKS